MKNNFISMLAVALGAAALFTSCEKEQSVFSPESLPGTCTLTGVVNYNEGFALVGDQLVSKHEVPASGQVIMLRIPNSAYLDPSYPNPNADSQIYTDTLDAEGRYEFTIPAPANGESLTGYLDVIPFKASYAEYFPNAQQLVEHESVIYNTSNSAQINIRDQFPVEQNFTVGCTPPQNDVQYNVPLTINGSNVTGPGFENTTSTPQAAYVFISTDILIRVNLTHNYDVSYNSTIYCTTQSDATTGEFTATVNLPEDFFTNYSATVQAQYVSCVKDFAFWYQDNSNEWNSTTLQLLYHSDPLIYRTVSVNDEHEYIPLEYRADNHVRTTVVTPDSDLILDNNPSAASFFGWNY